MKVSIDSCTIEPGDVFIPVKGQRFDGRQFIDEVLKKGGRVLDVDLCDYARNYRKKLRAKVIGIVGSAGKTTVKDMLAQALSSVGSVVKTAQNQNNEIGVSLTLLAADAKTDIVLVEMGMRQPGDLNELARIVQPDMVVFTGVGYSHAAFFKTRQALARAKSSVFRKALKWQVQERTCFLNEGSDFYDLALKKSHHAGYRVVPYSGVDKISENINVCYSVGGFFGVADSTVEQALQAYSGSDHRMHVDCVAGVTLIDDTYNSNPSGVVYALQYLRRFSGRKVVVFGDMLELGRYSQAAHQCMIQQTLEEDIAVLFLVGPLTKDVAQEHPRVVHFSTNAQCIKVLKDEIKPADVVLVKGSRSLKMEQIVAEVRRGLG